MRKNTCWQALIVILFGLLIWLAFFWQPAQPSPSSAQSPLGGEFTLQSPGGQVSLSDFRGRVVVLYFGYTFCPDICPTSLAILAQALSELTPAELKHVQGLFISLDPERDTLAVMNIYAPHFHPAILGLNGSPEQIAQAARQYGVRYMKQKPNASGQYAVDHTSFTYVIAPDGKLVASLPHASSAQQIVAMIRTQLRN